MEQSPFSEANMNPDNHAIPHFYRPHWCSIVFTDHFNLIHISCPSTLYMYTVYIVVCGPVAGQRQRDKPIQRLLLSNGFGIKNDCTPAIGSSNREMMFSGRFKSRCYKQDSWSNELVVRQPTAGKNVNTEAEDIVQIRHQATTDKNTVN
jgi:hypothetical protein